MDNSPPLLSRSVSTPPWFLLSRRKPPEAIQILMRRARRNPLNWVGPVCIVVVFSLLAASLIRFGPLVVFSIALFDYLIFLSVLLWSMKDAVQWRRGRALLEGAMLTSLTPEEVVLIPYHTQMAIWRPVLWLHVPVWMIGVVLIAGSAGFGFPMRLPELLLPLPFALLQLQFSYVSVILAVSMGCEAAFACGNKVSSAVLRLGLLGLVYVLGLSGLGLVTFFVTGGICSALGSEFSDTMIGIIVVVLASLVAIMTPLVLVSWLKMWFAKSHLLVATKALIHEDQ